ncbi:kinesin-like protein KIF23 isoform X1 [Temnothorax nylanderi]|uniref:kinesin-like protein KIF23 isoform X1 n=1 Tax=Temnothorax nylanderi TaxID=102681 RepID=UPI003A8A8791
MKPARSKTPARRPIGRPKGSNVIYKDPVQVYCRLRPMQSPTDVSCMRVTSDTTVVITPPESAANFRTTASKEIQTTFSHVFTPDVTQRKIFETVALPLVENLIHGTNGLLFTYGVTGSGKTYTMTGGELQDAGIMPRCLDVIFNTIANYQTKKFVFKPDKLNGFDVQSEADAAQDRQDMQRELLKRTGRLGKRRKVDSDGDSNPTVARERNESQSVAVETDKVYAVFVTYVEIYNNNVNDLLDEMDDIRTKTLQSKVIREDGNKNMYVHTVTEVEVKSAEEAFELFQRGQRKRRVAHTVLNAESSRSHSVFTIRLVKARLDPEGEYGMQYKRVVCVSQLSLVDLAGSERTNRTNNAGQRLREAGHINNSLTTLRSCLEILRENQNQGTIKMVPYRDSKLTYLFKNYFDGEGQVIRMIVCVNPRADDYDETIQVMKFAEMTQEVHITRSNPVKLDLGLTPSRRQVNKILKETRGKLERGRVEAVDLNIDVGLVYSLGGRFPQLETITSDNDQVILSLIQFLEQRINKRNVLRADLQKKQEDFRRILMGIEQENGSLKNEVAVLKTANTHQKRKISALEGHLCNTETQINDLSRELNNANDKVRSLQQEVRDRELALNQRSIDKQRVKQRYNTKMRVETDKLTREFEIKLHQGREHLQKQEDMLRQVKQIVDDNNINPAIASSRDQAPELTTRVVSSDRDTRISRKVASYDRIAVSNPRYRRSQSADRWIDHRPQTLVPIGTVLQPLMQRRRSVTQLTSPKEITDGASRYCLVAQEHDTDGELETKLYKGDILPTSGGGAQVVFNDMECLKQSSPKARKRTGPREEGMDQVDISTLTKTKRPRVIPS